MTDETRIQPNTKCVESVAHQLGTDGCEDTTDAWCIGHIVRQWMLHIFLTADGHTFESVSALMHYVLDRAGATVGSKASLDRPLRAPRHWSDGMCSTTKKNCYTCVDVFRGKRS